jgi:hypothetical protein
VPDAADTAVTRLRLDGPAPALGDEAGDPVVRAADTPLESWGLALQELLQRWV